MLDNGLRRENIVAVILAGGRGERLAPLTRDRTKGAVPFGGMYRLIDFTLSNALHSGLRQIYLLPQYKYASLKRHLKLGWSLFRSELEECLTVVPPQQGIVDGRYRGTADAVHLNREALFHHQPDYTVVLSSDHVCRMDYGDLVAFHRERDADLTIASVEVDLEDAYRYGILETGAEGRIQAFAEKPDPATLIPSSPEKVRASMGMYVFDTGCLREALLDDAARPDSAHDFGHDVIPRMIDSGCRVYAWDARFAGQTCYWRDIGESDAFWEANMDLLGSHPDFDMWDPHWPILSHRPQHSPARVTGNGELSCNISESLLSPGCSVDSAQITHSVLSPGVRVDAGSMVIDSVLFDGVHIGENARVERAILDKRVVVPGGCRVGGSARRHNCATVSRGGVTVVPKETRMSSNQTNLAQERSARHLRRRAHWRSDVPLGTATDLQVLQGAHDLVLLPRGEMLKNDPSAQGTMVRPLIDHATLQANQGEVIRRGDNLQYRIHRQIDCGAHSQPTAAQVTDLPRMLCRHRSRLARGKIGHDAEGDVEVHGVPQEIALLNALEPPRMGHDNCCGFGILFQDLGTEAILRIPPTPEPDLDGVPRLQACKMGLVDAQQRRRRDAEIVEVRDHTWTEAFGTTVGGPYLEALPHHDLPGCRHGLT